MPYRERESREDLVLPVTTAAEMLPLGLVAVLFCGVAAWLLHGALVDRGHPMSSPKLVFGVLLLVFVAGGIGQIARALRTRVHLHLEGDLLAIEWRRGSRRLRREQLAVRDVVEVAVLERSAGRGKVFPLCLRTAEGELLLDDGRPTMKVHSERRRDLVAAFLAGPRRG